MGVIFWLFREIYRESWKLWWKNKEISFFYQKKKTFIIIIAAVIVYLFGTTGFICVMCVCNNILALGRVVNRTKPNQAEYQKLKNPGLYAMTFFSELIFFSFFHSQLLLLLLMLSSKNVCHIGLCKLFVIFFLLLIYWQRRPLGSHEWRKITMWYVI